MAHDVFISYFRGEEQGNAITPDRRVADQICAVLEKQGISCFIDHRDILAGANWEKILLDAVEESRILVLVVSKSTEQSDWIGDEIRLALDNKIQIMPFCIEEVKPADFLRRLKLRCQWIHSSKQPPASHIERLLIAISRYLNKPYKVSQTSVGILEKITKPVGNLYWEAIKSRLVQIPGGRIPLKDNESGNEYTVEITPFLLDKYPMTQDIYLMVMGKRPSHLRKEKHPVAVVTWFDVIEFCNLLSEKLGFEPVYKGKGNDVTCNWESKGFRLPTEAEWEYASRAGTTGDHYEEIDKTAWYRGNSGEKTHGVGKKAANSWGLYDMLGNVWEWCWDWRGDYPKGYKKDYKGPDSGSYRIIRGGCYYSYADNCRVSFRSSRSPISRVRDMGFRLVRPL